METLNLSMLLDVKGGCAICRFVFKAYKKVTNFIKKIIYIGRAS